MYYFILQYPYDFVEIALCYNNTIVHRAQESKLHSVSLTIPHLQQLLDKEKITLQDISFIAVNTGPGPYNTLRSLITTANGIHFSKKTPLMEFGALDLLLSEQEQPSVAIFNAFANHVFYAFSTKTNKEQGYCSVEAIIQKINQEKESLLLIGNGVHMHQEALLAQVTNIIIEKNTPAFNSLQTLAQHAYEAAQKKQFASSYIMPKYLQSPAIKNKPLQPK